MMMSVNVCSGADPEPSENTYPGVGTEDRSHEDRWNKGFGTCPVKPVKAQH